MPADVREPLVLTARPSNSRVPPEISHPRTTPGLQHPPGPPRPLYVPPALRLGPLPSPSPSPVRPSHFLVRPPAPARTSLRALAREVQHVDRPPSRLHERAPDGRRHSRARMQRPTPWVARPQRSGRERACHRPRAETGSLGTAPAPSSRAGLPPSVT